MNFLKDIAAAVRLTGEVRRAREAGQTVEVRPVHTYTPAYSRTIEYCLEDKLGRNAHWNVTWIYNHLSYEDRRRLESSPVNAGWVDRARFWQQCLEPALPPKMYHHIMMQFISEYAHRQRLAMGVAI